MAAGIPTVDWADLTGVDTWLQGALKLHHCWMPSLVDVSIGLLGVDVDLSNW
jgi:hypothetical protein